MRFSIAIWGEDNRSSPMEVLVLTFISPGSKNCTKRPGMPGTETGLGEPGTGEARTPVMVRQSGRRLVGRCILKEFEGSKK